MITYSEMVIKALKKMLASVWFIKLTLLTLIRESIIKTIALFGLNTEETCWEVHTITRFSLDLLVYIIAESM